MKENHQTLLRGKIIDGHIVTDDEPITSNDLLNEEDYQILLRAIDWTEGFGLFFVECTPVQGKRIVERTQQGLSNKKVELLELTAPLAPTDSLYQRIAALPQREQLKILFIQGIEKSFEEYIKAGSGGLGDYYKDSTVPRVLGHLNLQRERFRDNFPFCLVFLLPTYALKYFILRCADFFDWRSGVFQFRTEEVVRQREIQLLLADKVEYEEYAALTPQQRHQRILELQTWIDEALTEEKVELLSKQALLFHIDHHFLAVLANCDQVIAFKPDDHEAWYNRGITLDNLGRYEEAIASYDKALAFKPDDYRAWNNRGALLCDNLGHYEEAIASYDKVLALKPDFHVAWDGRGITLGNLGRYEEAIASFDKALALKPDKYEAWYNRGVALRNLGHYEEAIASYDKALAIKPDYHEVWDNRGALLCDKLGRYEEALANFNKVLALKPDDYGAWYNRGNALSNLGRYEEAVASFDKALTLKSDYYEAWINRGALLCDKLGRYEEAIASFDKVLALKPDFQLAQQNKIIALRKLGGYRETYVAAQKPAELNPEFAEQQLTIAIAQHKRGYPQQFRKKLKKIGWYALGFLLIAIALYYLIK